MSSEPTAAELLAAVQRSPQLVAVHDRAAWCSLYTRDGEVNDPVGSKPHTGRAAIERFYDTFIAPNGIRFQVEQDVVCGMSVFRDLMIETTMSTGVVLNVPMHLRYDVQREAGELKIRRLFAHWELPDMIFQLLGTGPKGWWTSLKLGPQLIQNQGLGGVAGFMRGFVRVGRKGKLRAQRFFAATARGDLGAAALELDTKCRLEAPFGAALGLSDFAKVVSGLRWHKMLASGNTVTTSIHLDGKRGIALCKFAGRDRISSVQIFI